MPGRKLPLVTEEIYHVFNRSTDRRPIFAKKMEARRALQAIRLYQLATPPMRLAYFLNTSPKKRNKITVAASKNGQLVQILSFCLMPNHLHLLLKQKTDNGISKFMSQLQNSFTRYFNTKNKRVGPLFAGPFKAVRIETEDQLLHVSRYIHLNPYSSYVVKKIKDLPGYQFSSLPEYISPQKSDICFKKPILAHFKNKKDYKKFVFDQADYQRSLEEVKHLCPPTWEL